MNVEGCQRSGNSVEGHRYFLSRSFGRTGKARTLVLDKKKKCGVPRPIRPAVWLSSAHDER